MLVVLTPVADPHFVAFDFHKCVVNVQNALMNEDLHLAPCNVGDSYDPSQCSVIFVVICFWAARITGEPRASYNGGESPFRKLLGWGN